MAEHTFAGLRCPEVADLAPAFVLGALEPAESDAVRRHLAECPEAHAEFAELHSVVPALFEAAEPMAAPAGLKDRILAAAAAELKASKPAPGETVEAPPPAVERQRGNWTGFLRRPVWAAVALAAAVAVVALGVWNVQLQNQLAGLTAYRNGVVELLDQAAKPGAQLAVLASAEADGPSGLAAVSADGTISVVMRDLAPTTGSQVYETWVIGGDGTPVPVGGFTVAADGTATFVTARAGVEQGVTVALTREAGPGARTPTLPIIAAGKAQGQPS